MSTLSDVASRDWEERAESMPLIANVIDEWIKRRDGKSVPVRRYKAIGATSAELVKIAGGWPRCAGGRMFAPSDGQGGSGDIRWLESPEDLFAWMQERCELRWSKSEAISRETRAPRNPPTKSEFYRHLQVSGCERFAAVTTMPHFPPIAGYYYMLGDQPDAASGFPRLREFLSRLNPKTELDRQLLLGVILTIGWGGEPGTRPAFVLTSDEGQAAGKTSTAEAIADIWGGCARLDYSKDWGTNSKELMSSGDADKRVILWDNVRGRFGGKGIDAAITSRMLSGWRSYVGVVSRPNDTTHLITYNLPQLSRDLTSRAVVIHIGAPQPGVPFVEWAARYVREHGAEMRAEAIAMLAGPRRTIPESMMIRFSAWQREVIGVLPDAEALSSLIISRRGSVDADADEAEELRACLVAEARRQGHGGDEIEMHSDQIYRAAIAGKLWRVDPSVSERADRKKCVIHALNVLSGMGVIVPTEPAKLVRVTAGDGSSIRCRTYRIRTGNEPIEPESSDIPV